MSLRSGEACIMAPESGDCNKNDGPVKREIIPARAGRENQRYGDGGERLTAGCIVLRQGEGGSRECLVISSSRDSCKWVFPKGGWENDESLEEAARRETLEEAGVVVELRQNLGWFSTGVSKSGEKEGQVCMFEAVCLEQLEHWAEGFRCRQWVHITEVSKVCKHDYMLQVIERLRAAEASPQHV